MDNIDEASITPTHRHIYIAELLYSIGWSSPNDAQWTKLRDAIPEIKEMLRDKSISEYVPFSKAEITNHEYNYGTHLPNAERAVINRLNMNDKELLELSAKAIGGLELVGENGWIEVDAQGNRGYWWEPLTDDGDALRLAVKLGLQITPYPVYDQEKHSVIATKKMSLDDMDCPRSPRPFRICPDCDPKNCHKPIEPYAIELLGDDPYSATRRAIVRASAEIGKRL